MSATPTIPDLAPIPRDALLAELLKRPGITPHVLCKDTTLTADFCTFTEHKMSRDTDRITGPCTVLVIDPEETA